MNDVTRFAFDKLEVFVPVEEDILSPATMDEFKKLLYRYPHGTPVEDLWEGKKPDAYYLLMRELREMEAVQYDQYYKAFLDFLHERPTVEATTKIYTRLLGAVANREALPDESQKRDHDIFLNKLGEFDIVETLDFSGYPAVRDRHSVCKNIDAKLAFTHLRLTEEKCRREGLLRSTEFVQAIYPVSKFYLAFLDQKAGQ